MLEEKTKTLFVSGTFDDNEGRKSKIGEIIFRNLWINHIDYWNGGNYGALERMLTTGKLNEYGKIFWFPEIRNCKDKLVKRIKSINPQTILITSKNNADKKYSITDIIYHGLNNHSNLMLEFTRNGYEYTGTVLDPLGNTYIENTDSFERVARILKMRTEELEEYTRIGSESVGEGIGPVIVDEEFLEVVRAYADIFHNIIHPKGDAAQRFMGNASFRCEYGFPSMKHNGGIFVSRRNIDKRELTPGHFVHVEPGLPVKYHGNIKPSVDTPIQLKLYAYYQNMRYMIHSHTYIDGAPYTKKIIPCGAIEEFEEIREIVPSSAIKQAHVNLRGHGSLVMGADVSTFHDIPYIARPIPELHREYEVMVKDV